MKTSLVQKAIQLAVVGHLGQTRKESKMPYITHPFAVALQLAKHGFSDVVIAAALTHDVIEDTKVTREELEKTLGGEVLGIVEAMSFDEDKTLPWEERKKQYIESVRAASEDVKAVSIADKIHNLECMLEGEAQQGEVFWKYFTRGRADQVWLVEELLKMFRGTYQHPLVNEYARLVEVFKRGS